MQIGNVTFEDMRGQMIPTYADGVETFLRTGLDGIGYRVDAKRANAIEKQTIEWVKSLSEAIATSDVYNELRGKKVRVVERNGRVIDEVLVLEIRIDEPKRMLQSYPKGYHYQIRAIWFLQPTKVKQ